MEQSEEYRSKWALGLTLTFSVLIFMSFGVYKGYFDIGFNKGNLVSEEQVAVVVTASDAPSPVENTKRAFSAVFEEFSVQYQKIKESLAFVLIPFWSNIDVYEK